MNAFSVKGQWYSKKMSRFRINFRTANAKQYVFYFQNDMIFDCVFIMSLEAAFLFRFLCHRFERVTGSLGHHSRCTKPAIYLFIRMAEKTSIIDYGNFNN